ncbi:MAG: hypothetical protein KAX62_00510 [Xylophilus sp.]|nr:hypothetical protein [Xylophilus sp.]
MIANMALAVLRMPCQRKHEQNQQLENQMVKLTQFKYGIYDPPGYL